MFIMHEDIYLFCNSLFLNQSMGLVMYVLLAPLVRLVLELTSSTRTTSGNSSIIVLARVMLVLLGVSTYTSSIRHTNSASCCLNKLTRLCEVWLALDRKFYSSTIYPVPVLSVAVPVIVSSQLPMPVLVHTTNA